MNPPPRGKGVSSDNTIISREPYMCIRKAFFMAQQPLVDRDLLVIEASLLHPDSSHSVGLLWTSDQPDTQTSTWQHTTLTGERYLYSPSRFNPHNPRKREAEDPRLRIGVRILLTNLGRWQIMFHSECLFHVRPTWRTSECVRYHNP